MIFEREKAFREGQGMVGLMGRDIWINAKLKQPLLSYFQQHFLNLSIKLDTMKYLI